MDKRKLYQKGLVDLRWVSVEWVSYMHWRRFRGGRMGLVPCNILRWQNCPPQYFRELIFAFRRPARQYKAHRDLIGWKPNTLHATRTGRESLEADKRRLADKRAGDDDNSNTHSDESLIHLKQGRNLA